MALHRALLRMGGRAGEFPALLVVWAYQQKHFFLEEGSYFSRGSAEKNWCFSPAFLGCFCAFGGCFLCFFCFFLFFARQRGKKKGELIFKLLRETAIPPWISDAAVRFRWRCEVGAALALSISASPASIEAPGGPRGRRQGRGARI